MKLQGTYSMATRSTRSGYALTVIHVVFATANKFVVTQVGSLFQLKIHKYSIPFLAITG
jgi:hypothetical protein